MLNRLLESKTNHELFTGGALTSVAAHTVVIGLAIYATAQARVVPTRPAEVIRPFYVATPKPPTLSQRGPGTPSNAISHRLLFVNPALNITVAPVDIPLTTVGQGDFGHDPLGSGEVAGAGGGVAESGYGTFRADQVERQVSLISGSAAPRYPEVLRTAGVEGKVVAQFVVDAEGRVEGATIKLVRSDNPLFDDAVRSTLVRMRFTPAEIAGRKVRQLVEMPFVFALSR